MATHLSATELRNMQMDDLRKEIAEKRLVIAKMRINVHMRSEKDTARFLREKKELARMLTIASEKTGAAVVPALKKTSKKATVPASAKALANKSAPATAQ